MTTCRSVIKTYPTLLSSVTISESDYPLDCIKPPPPFTINVNHTNNNRFVLTMSFPNETGYSITIDNINGVLQFPCTTDQQPGFTYTTPYASNISECETNCGTNCNGLYIKDSLVVRLALGDISSSQTYNVNPNTFLSSDIYEIYLYTCNAQGVRGAAVDFIRNYGGLPVNNSMNSMLVNDLPQVNPVNGTMSLRTNSLTNKCSTGLCNKNITQTCNTVRIPGLDIFGQSSTLTDEFDMGEVIFTIRDEFKYYEEVPIAHKDQCKVRFLKIDEIKVTRFKKCPELVSVLSGKGDTLLAKAKYLYDYYQILESGVVFTDFYSNILYYAMAKYILSRILYGKFSINYLLGKYNDKFLKDLNGSRFCGFLTIFEDCQSAIYGYNKYFKSGDKK